MKLIYAKNQDYLKVISQIYGKKHMHIDCSLLF